MLAALSVVDEGQDRVEVRGGAAVVRKEVEVKLGVITLFLTQIRGNDAADLLLVPAVCTSIPPTPLTRIL